MPLGSKPVCTACKTSTTSMWRKNKAMEVVCNSCFQNPNSATQPVQAVVTEPAPTPTNTVPPQTTTTKATPAVPTNGKESPVPIPAVQPERKVTSTSTNGGNGNGGPILRKSARIKPSKHRFQSSTRNIATKGKSRRITFKKSVSFVFVCKSIDILDTQGCNLYKLSQKCNL